MTARVWLALWLALLAVDCGIRRARLTVAPPRGRHRAVRGGLAADVFGREGAP